MTEYDLIYLASEYNDIVMGLLQVWLSISFGLVAVAYFASHKLNSVLLVVLNFLYISSTIFIFIALSRNIGIQASFSTELSLLAEQTELSVPGNLISQGIPLVTTVFALISEFGTFIGCIFFLNYSFFKKDGNG